jgi:hypothetical protein
MTGGHLYTKYGEYQSKIETPEILSLVPICALPILKLP